MKFLVCSAVLFAQTSLAATVVVQASKDNTLFEDSAGSYSNGAGPYMYAGRVGPFGGNMDRRGLIAFDVASAVPAGAMIESVSLTLYVYNPNSVLAADIKLYALTADWGEGASDAGLSGGTGVTPLPGDATWIHRTFSAERWASPGGDFVSTLSAKTIAYAEGKYQFSAPKMVADVQSWLDSPDENFGWIILGSDASASARRIGSRENPELNERPSLSISYTVVPEAHTGALLVSGTVFFFGRRRRLRGNDVQP